MKIILKPLLYAIILGTVISCSPKTETDIVLKEAFKEHFLIGAALNTDQYKGLDKQSIAIVKEHCNTIVAENDMKSMFLQPEEGKFFFDDSDKFVAFGEANNMFIVGHNLIWHSQAPDWFFVDENGEDVSRDVMIERMHKHIATIVGRYKGRVHGWDVVNEAISDREGLRKSKFLDIIGPEYLELAFQFAHEADPNAELYYNDYSMNVPRKRDEAVKLAKNLIDKGIQIDGIGMQAHYGLDYDVFEDVEASIKAFSALKLKVMITELDVTVLPNPGHIQTAEVSTKYELKEEFNPYITGIPEAVQDELSNYYAKLFKIFIKYSNNISRVTFWGVTDNQSWKNDWPVPGRTDYPLVFDREYNAKPALDAIIAISKN